jgi:hypothetical protein
MINNVQGRRLATLMLLSSEEAAQNNTQPTGIRFDTRTFRINQRLILAVLLS